MSVVMKRLKIGRCLAWADLVPAFDHAIVLAKEAEHRAATASLQVLSNIEPEYPPLVELLADSARKDDDD